MKRFLAGNATPLSYYEDLVCFDSINGIRHPAGPQHLQAVRLRRLVQPEVHAQIVLPLVTRTRLDVARESFPTDGEFQAGANPVPIAFDAHSADQDRVIPIAAVVAQEIGGLPVVADDDIQVAVIV